MPLTKVTSGAITDSAITTAKIEDGTIVNADISASANISQSKLSLSLPTISSITIQDSQGAIPPSDTSLYFDIIGTNFTNPSTVELLNSSTNASTNATTVTYVSATQLRVTASLSAGTYKIRVTRSDGFAGISATALLTVSQAVSWSTSAGSLGTFDESVAISTITLSATSNSSVTYAIQSGSLPSGLSLSSAGAITGTPSAVAADTTSTFTIRATDAESQYADREFTITVTNVVIAQSLRFNDDDNAYLSRTLSASPTNQKIITFSYWAKRGNLGVYSYNLVGNTSSPYVTVGFLNDDTFSFQLNAGSGSTGLITSSVYRDTSAWYHLLVSMDTTQATDSDRVKMYVNGVQVTNFGTANYPAQDSTWNINTNVVHSIGGSSAIQDFDGYMAEVHFIDGQALTPTSFGETGSNGRWKPKTYSGTYGTNGFYLDFADSGNLGADSSGNSNTFTATNLAAADQVKDTPQNNFATLNPLLPVQTHTLSEGNLKSTNSSATHGGTTATINYPTSGKWYHEVRINAEDSSKGQGVAIGNQVYRSVTDWGNYTNLIGYMSDGTKSIDTGYSSYGTAHNAGDIIGVAYNADDQELTFYHNNSSQGTIPTSEMNGKLDFNNISPIVFGRDMGQTFNFGQDSSFAGATTRQNNTDDNGEGDFYYTPPSGYLALCTDNLPEPTIKDPSAYFHTQLYSGNSTDDRNITNNANAGDFQPDFLWIKERTSTSSHQLIDSTRGSSNALLSDSTGAEDVDANRVQSFQTNGFQVGTASTVNESGQTYVAWQWKANGGTTSSNTDGTITSTVQANTTAGFSIVTYTGTGSAGTVGHGLGKTPHWVVVKDRTSAGAWYNQHIENSSASYGQALNTDGAEQILSAVFNDTRADSSVFYLGNNINVNTNGNSYVAYIFAPIEGYSKFGKWVGNGSTTDANRPFIYTGFKPAMVIWKARGDTTSWRIMDTARDIDNPSNARLFPNTNEAESTGYSAVIDFLSNGFKIRGTHLTGINSSGVTYIYMAFAESPFGGILTTETTAR